MDNRPIGFFDSGLGGLTCIPYLIKELPEEKIIYFGDTARTPYGSKAASTIRNFSVQITDFLVKNDVKMIVIACNTVSAVAIFDIRNRFPDIPVIGIIKPAAEKVVKTCSQDNKIGIIGTKAMIVSGVYDKLIKEQNSSLNVFYKACPAFVPLIEEGIINSDIMNLTIKHYMDDFILKNGIDTLVLGCTHYPLIRDGIENIYEGVRIIDPSQEIISKIRAELTERKMHANGSKHVNTFYASDLSENFMDMVDRIFANKEVSVKFKNLD